MRMGYRALAGVGVRIVPTAGKRPGTRIVRAAQLLTRRPLLGVRMANRLLTVTEWQDRVGEAWRNAVAQSEIAGLVLPDQHLRLWGCPEWSPRLDGLSWRDTGVVSV